MYLKFAWRYFKARKSTNAINIIAWVTTGVIAFAVCCQLLVLSVFNGLEDLVKSLYASFYTDLKIEPESGKTFVLTPDKLLQIKKDDRIGHVSLFLEEKALIQNGEIQSVIQLKGVDENFRLVSGLPAKVYKGSFNIGTAALPQLVLGAGVQSAAGVTMNEAFGPEPLTLILPRVDLPHAAPLESLSEGIATPSGVFSIQQDFDNQYVITNLPFLRAQLGMDADRFSGAELKLKSGADVEAVRNRLQELLGPSTKVLTRYEQNKSLYSTMRAEKWIIYGILTLVLIIAAFNMIGALTMLVLEKKQDISVLNSMGAHKGQIRRIFITEGLLLGGIGACLGLLMAYLLCFLQMKFHLIKISGTSFIINYFPVSLLLSDFMLVSVTVMSIVLFASWLPTKKASTEALSLK